jgi:hypothetical protein
LRNRRQRLEIKPLSLGQQNKISEVIADQRPSH